MRIINILVQSVNFKYKYTASNSRCFQKFIHTFIYLPHSSEVANISMDYWLIKVYLLFKKNEHKKLFVFL